MTDQAVLEYARDGAVATLTLNRPEAMNALDTALKVALRDGLRHAAGDPDVRAVVLTGAGRAFCVGQDLAEHAHNLEHQLDSVWSTVPEHYSPIAELIATMPKPVIAAVNGVAAGAGLAFALGADFRIAAEHVKITTAFAGVGLSADSASSWWLPRIVGTAKAKELLLLSPTLTAAEALELGLVTEVVPAEQVLPRAQELAARMAAGPTTAYGAIRRAVAYSAAHDLPASLEHEGELMALTGHTEDHRRAVKSFLAKQRPTFSGR